VIQASGLRRQRLTLPRLSLSAGATDEP